MKKFLTGIIAVVIGLVFSTSTFVQAKPGTPAVPAAPATPAQGKGIAEKEKGKVRVINVRRAWENFEPVTLPTAGATPQAPAAEPREKRYKPPYSRFQPCEREPPHECGTWNAERGIN